MLRTFLMTGQIFLMTDQYKVWPVTMTDVGTIVILSLVVNKKNWKKQTTKHKPCFDHEDSYWFELLDLGAIYRICKQKDTTKVSYFKTFIFGWNLCSHRFDLDILLFQKGFFSVVSSSYPDNWVWIKILWSVIMYAWSYGTFNLFIF